MPEFRDRLASAEVSVRSPNGALRLGGGGSGNLTVTIPAGALGGWTEAALEREIVGLIDAALLAARRIYVQARREAFNSDDHRHRRDADPPRPRWRSKPRVEVFRDSVEQIPVEGVSLGGHVLVSRDENHQFQVTVRRGVLDRLPERELSNEISSALADALATYNQAYATAYRSAFGRDLATS